MSKIIVWTSPKTAGASSVSLNAAMLQAGLNSTASTALVEVAAWSSQATLFPKLAGHHWGELIPFLGTAEWQPELLGRAETKLGPSVFWSPTGEAWPAFNQKFVDAWLELLRQRYSVIYVDLSASVDPAWQQWWLGQADQVVGVVTPDPLSLQAWGQWSAAQSIEGRLSWVLNQVPGGEKKSLLSRFSHSDSTLLGALRQEPRTFWRQHYQSFPVVLNRRSGFKKDLLEVLSALSL